eukprot:366424-Chlamydomonas_euryale.AAC.2
MAESHRVGGGCGGLPDGTRLEPAQPVPHNASCPEAAALKATVVFEFANFEPRTAADVGPLQGRVPPRARPDRAGREGRSCASMLGQPPGVFQAVRARPCGPLPRIGVLQAGRPENVQGWNAPTVSPFGSPTILVKKKCGAMRFCIDCRKLNNITFKNLAPMPAADYLLEKLHGAKYYFFKIDLASGYHQIHLSPR